MMKSEWKTIGILFLVFGLATPAFAVIDEKVVEDLQKKVYTLTNRVEQLEAEKSPPTYVAPSGQAPSGNAIEGAMSGIRLSGFVDTAYHWNFQNPTHPVPTGATVDRNQSIGVFDTESNSFTFHALELALEKPVPSTGGVGFRADILVGEDAKVISSGGAESDEFDLEQGYVEARLPLHALDGNSILGNTVDIKAGKYVTLAGAEVIEAKDNWNTTRSLLFGYAIPFTHTGARAAYDLWGGKVTTTLGVNNGWDLLEDNNNFKTFEGQIAYKPNDDLLFTLTSYMGPENQNQAGHKRYLYDFVALWKATDKLSLMANIDLGNQKRIPQADRAFENAFWHGYALYARYQATDKLAFATRGELFVDQDNFRVGTGAIAPALDYIAGTTVTSFPGIEHKYWEWTYTTEYKLYENLISRLEYRYDWSDAPVFSGESSQSTLSAQLIYNFA